MNSTSRSPYFQASLFLLIPFSGFFSVKLGVSPVYVAFVISVILVLAGVLGKFIIWRRNAILLFIISLILYSLILRVSIWNFIASANSAWFNYVFSFIYFSVVVVVLDNSSTNDVIKASRILIMISVFLLVFEFLFRVFNPSMPLDLGHAGREDMYWYVYKTNSFMYEDSNSIGLFSACLFVFTLQIGVNYWRWVSFMLLPIFFIVLGSLSRSAIVSTLVICLYSLLKSKSSKLIYLGSLVLIACLFVFSAGIEDESVLTRFWIAGLVFNYISDVDVFSLLFGVGPGNAESVLSVGAHLLPFVLLVETGVVGSLLIVLLWYFIYRRACKTSGLLFFVFILNGFSFTTFAVPWFYVMLSIFVVLEERVAHGKFTARVNSFAGSQC